MISDFYDYLESTFFSQDPEGFEAYKQACKKPLKKTIRINSKRISPEDFQKNHPQWDLLPTGSKNVFGVDRPESELFRALGSTQEHLSGQFYIQELAASHSVEVLRNSSYGGISPDALESSVILDMCASPGGKTTQLSENFPNSFIVANESSKDRLAQLIENTERMGAESIGIVLGNGLSYGDSHPEYFDIVLLDAPCSGEGTLFKHENAASFWNEKGIKKISRLQSKLIESAWKSLKVGGFLLYSTCTLNEFENESVLDSLRELAGDGANFLFQKRFWPHIDEAGGFFISKIQKTAPLPGEERKEKYRHGSREIRQLSKKNEDIFIANQELAGFEFLSPMTCFEFRNEILACKTHPKLGELIRDLSFLRFGVRLGKIEKNSFIWNHFGALHGKFTKLPHFLCTSESSHKYLSGNSLKITEGTLSGPMIYDIENGWVALFMQQTFFGVAPLKMDTIENIFPKEWRRK